VKQAEEFAGTGAVEASFDETGGVEAEDPLHESMSSLSGLRPTEADAEAVEASRQESEFEAVEGFTPPSATESAGSAEPTVEAYYATPEAASSEETRRS
jgi:hypothetical protein